MKKRITARVIEAKSHDDSVQICLRVERYNGKDVVKISTFLWDEDGDEYYYEEKVEFSGDQTDFDSCCSYIGDFSVKAAEELIKRWEDPFAE